ncbi:alanine/glycine:cation symporter family protein [Trueperella sp. LYQ143]|uniref:alanine/glycine:cation symporter family protein n=1 Tax=unclassified Trueperella TaxID=2630174 RepID=UPI0039835F82
METINSALSTISSYLYSYVLIALLILGGLYFFIRTKAAPLRLFGDSIKVIAEKPHEEESLSSFKALMVSTASRVGTGNIVGVAVAIAIGGPGAVFWMWVIATIGAASALIESVLAQIYKRRADDGHSYGGPAWYIKHGLKQGWLGGVFAVVLILTYMGGFNMLASYNVVGSFGAYSFFEHSWAKYLLGAILALAMAASIFGGTRKLADVTGVLVPIMAIIYCVAAIIVIGINIDKVPDVLSAIFKGAFDFEAIFGGFAGSAMMQGIKRGLYSNEAGIGSAPNAAASASVSHPVKQGLVQMLSVFIDTMIICTFTGFLVLFTGKWANQGEDPSGAEIVQGSLQTVFGHAGVYLVTISLLLFGFTTFLGNFYYAEINFRYLLGRLPKQAEIYAFRALACLLVFVGAFASFDVAWNTADILMGLMALINIPVIILLGKHALRAVEDYHRQRKSGKDPHFTAESIGMDTGALDYWK